MGRRSASLEFVGREDDLAALQATFDRACGGDAAMVLVTGEAGIGKTRLVRRFFDLVPEGTIIATGSCVPIDDGGLPYAPVVGILRSLARQLDEEAAAGPTGALDALMPPLGAPAEAPPPSDPNARRGGLADTMAKLRLFDSITSCLTEVAARDPLIVLLEDLHWADSTSAELLHFLTRNLVEARVLIIGTCRTEELSVDHPLRGRLTEIGRHEMVSHIDLQGLEREQTARLIEGIIGQPPDRYLVDGVWARSQGNPFFVEELTATRHSQALSDGLVDVVRSSVERLSPDAQHLLQIVAACGAGADHRLAAQVSTLGADDLDRLLGEVVDRHILVVDTDEGTYGFRHALLREAVYASMLPAERERLHRRLAVALTADATLGPTEPGRRSSELAQHWWAAREWGQAHEASVESGHIASRMRAFPEAYDHLARALEAVSRMPADEVPDRVPIVEEAAELAGLCGDGARAVELASELVDLIDPTVDPRHAARALTMLGRNTWSTGDATAVLDAYARARDLLPPEPSPELAMVLAEEGGILMVTSRLVEGEHRCREAIEVARAIGARQVEGKALNTLGCCRSLLGFSDEGIAQLRESLAIAHELHNPDDLNRAYGNLGGCLLDADRLEEAAALVYESVEVAEGIWGMGLEMAVTNSAEALIRLGRYDQAEGLLSNLGDRALGSCESGPPIQRMALDIRRGDLDAADRQRLVLDDMTAPFSDVQVRGGFHLLCAELAAERGRPEEADTEIEQALALAATTDDHQFSLQMCAVGARVIADQFVHGRSDGRPVDRTKLELRAEGMADEAGRLLAACADRGGEVTARLRGLEMTARAERSRTGEPDPAPWAEAAAQWEQTSDRYDLAYCRWRQAEAHLAGRSNRSAAAECLRAAAEISREIGARHLTDEIEALARRARIALFDAEVAVDRSATVASDLGLTPREVEVLALLAVGSTDREIADQLFISKKTASVHVSNLIRKLGVSNRVEAGRIGQTHLAALDHGSS
ncbi:helix-turn-helix transcriptional regulator [Aquihabitans sp. McL0605]|uniref:helix-turn-helix transcriptional regulator n=1 Tax=Aquihabitans sp. McL0605 TaxID=3415671 RepID=UPI003CF17900